ncbi:MAG: hypothetical protein OXH19_06955 [Chloroflexi bacterium]|nr:hypothetical protein [Chloroflexota bacterium]MCY3587242.1 hypothetical protein [Chloroflexota bacterium]MCY3685352.1 hypothetical protein [Chloroflexota bacterium]MDE2707493.1 hypothetical protein [Chloroflexota bacterium]MDE2987700.1 hypothetical protein [Chloroflexota bacterium]
MCRFGDSVEAALVPCLCLSADHSGAERAAARYSDMYPAHEPLGQTDIIVA